MKFMDLVVPTRVAIPAFGQLDMAARFPGLFSDSVLPGRGGRAGDCAEEQRRQLERLKSFLRSLRTAFEQPESVGPGYTDECKALVNGSQMTSIIEGQFVAQEVGDVMLMYASRLLGFDFFNDAIIAGGEGREAHFSELSLPDAQAQRCLVVATHVPDALIELKLGPDNVYLQYCERMAQCWQTYDVVCIPICNRFHYRAVVMRRHRESPGKEAGGSTTVTLSTVTTTVTSTVCDVVDSNGIRSALPNRITELPARRVQTDECSFAGETVDRNCRACSKRTRLSLSYHQQHPLDSLGDSHPQCRYLALLRGDAAGIY